jgi:hypothetical protein
LNLNDLLDWIGQHQTIKRRSPAPPEKQKSAFVRFFHACKASTAWAQAKSRDEMPATSWLR